jgi:hypothetical protein
MKNRRFITAASRLPVKVKNTQGDIIMHHSITLNEAIETVSQLPAQQQEMLLEIVHHRLAEARRKGIADSAQQAKDDLANGRIKPQSAAALINELHQTLSDET